MKINANNYSSFSSSIFGALQILLYEGDGNDKANDNFEKNSPMDKVLD